MAPAVHIVSAKNVSPSSIHQVRSMAFRAAFMAFLSGLFTLVVSAENLRKFVARVWISVEVVEKLWLISVRC